MEIIHYDIYLINNDYVRASIVMYSFRIDHHLLNKGTRPVLSFVLSALLLTTLIFYSPSIADINRRPAEGSGPDDFRFTAVGDWGCTSATSSMASLMSTKNPQVVLGLGDYSYTTTMGCWHDILSSYPIIHDTIHTYNSVAFGNHELNCGNIDCLNATGLAEYQAHFNQPPTYFSFDNKRVHFVALDTNAPFTSGSSQYAFISADLAQAKQRKDNGFIDWIVAFMHHPFYTSCVNNPCDAGHGNKTAIRVVYQPLFDQYAVDVVLQSHVHAYERMKPLKSGAIIAHPDTFDYTNPKGQIYVTVGTGGRSSHDYSTHPEMSVIQLEDIFGFLQVDVTRTTFVGQFIDTNNTVRDSFIIIKTNEQVPSPPSPPPPPSQSPNPPSYYFNGNNYTQVASNSSLQLTQFSVATWFKFDTDYSSQLLKRMIVNKGGFGSETAGKNMNYGIWVDYGATNGNKLEAGFETTAGPDIFVRSPAKYNDGQWHYSVLTYDNAVLRLYIDGSLVASKATTAIPDNTGTQPLRLGMNSQALDRAYVGYADEVRVWNRALTAQEVSDQFNLGTFDTTGQVLYLTP